MSLLTSNEERQPLAVTPGGRWLFEGLIGTTRDDATSIYSSRGYLVTVLGEFVRPNGGAAWTQTLIEALSLCRVSEKATRQLLARSEDRGWLVRSRQGRRTKWHLTESFATVLEAGAERIYRHGADFDQWDGRWLVAIVSMPDGEGDRHRLTTGLRWNGLGTLGNGVWIGPRVSVEEDVAGEIDRAGVRDPVLFRAEIGLLGDDAELARRAWDLDRLGAAYASFRHLASRYFGWTHPESNQQMASELIGLVHQWRQFPMIDPDLPRALLPDEWPAADAAECFASLRRYLHTEATEWWLGREKHYGRN